MKIVFANILPETSKALAANGVNLNRLTALLLDEWARDNLKVPQRVVE